MKKAFVSLMAVGLLTPFFAFANESHSTSTNATSTPSSINVICVQNAIEKRDTTIITAHNAYNTSITNALTARKDALKLAWAKPTTKERREAQRAAYKAFNVSVRAAHENLRSARKAAWSTFNTDMKNCGVRNHGEQAQGVENPTSSL